MAADRQAVRRATTPAEPRSIYVRPWRIDLTVRADLPRLVPAAGLARLVGTALDAAGARPPASLGLILTGDGELAGLNAEHMGKTGPTDVLSFPLLPPSAFPSHGGRPGIVGDAPNDGFVLPPGARLHLGDIVVSVERAIAQADEGRGGWTGDVRWSPADELRLLVIHGVLHICGWDHAEAEERDAMRRLEAHLLDPG